MVWENLIPQYELYGTDWNGESKLLARFTEQRFAEEYIKNSASELSLNRFKKDSVLFGYNSYDIVFVPVNPILKET